MFLKIILKYKILLENLSNCTLNPVSSSSGVKRPIIPNSCWVLCTFSVVTSMVFMLLFTVQKVNKLYEALNTDWLTSDSLSTLRKCFHWSLSLC